MASDLSEDHNDEDVGEDGDSLQKKTDILSLMKARLRFAFPS